MKVEEINNEIYETKKRIINTKYDLAQNKLAITTYEKNIMGQIANVVDDKQKPVFSNQEKREAEFGARTSLDADYLALKEYTQNKSREIDELYAELEFKQNVFLIEMEKIRLGVKE